MERNKKLDFFPHSNEEGSKVELQSELMHSISETGTPLSKREFDEILSNHLLFIQGGGTGGTWQSLEVGGLTMAIYNGPKSSMGKQASFLNSNLSLLNLNDMKLPCCDFVNICYKNGNFRNSQLQNSIFIDSVLVNSDFSGADLSACDFSRAIMVNCRFVDANLTDCDFENCDLSHSNFQGAKTSGSRFPGAILENVLF
jgi:uncharacterized protein YjbI with pentapeptide repeats